MTSMAALRRKSRLLTGYLEHLVLLHYGQQGDRPDGPTVHILTPSDPEQRGCQLSLSFSVHIKRVFEELERRGVAVSSGPPRGGRGGLLLGVFLNPMCVCDPVRHEGAQRAAGGAGSALQLLHGCPPLRGDAGFGAGRRQQRPLSCGGAAEPPSSWILSGLWRWRIER